MEERLSPGSQDAASRHGVSPKHYLVLDGLRGVAAFSVMAMHTGAWFNVKGVCSHAYLAVDFFFLLSGFVLAHAYESRLAQARLSTLRFLLLRVVRLYPMILLGVTISSGFFLLRYAGGHTDFTLEWILFGIGGGIGLVPMFAGPAAAEVFPLNGPMWSLFFELVANALYAAAIRVLKTPLLVVMTGLAGAALVVCALFSNKLDLGDHVRGFGWGWARVGFSFFAGVLIHRFKPQERWRGPSLSSLSASVLLLALFCVPRTIAWCGAYDLVCAFVFFPALMVLCVNAQAEGLAGRLCALSGELSYPVYVLQKPITLWLTSLYLSLHILALPRPLPGLVATVVIALVSLAALKLWDEPIRSVLARSLRMRTAIMPLANEPA